MVNPGAFSGSRKEFLLAEKENYAAGMEGSYGADALAQIQRWYFKRFPVELGHFEEPSHEHLAAIDDDAPDPEPEEPNSEKLTPEEYEAGKKKSNHRKEVIRFRKAQIKRWLAYQYMKDQDLDLKESGTKNPFHSLIFTITGKEAGRPRRRTAVNVWRKTKRHDIDAKVARDMFNKLPSTKQEHWKQQAITESEIVLEDWKRLMLSNPPSEAKDYQVAIQGLVHIAQPFLDFVCKATGWKATLIAGGPESVQGGKLNVISIHSGYMPGDVKLTWGCTLHARYKKDVVSCFRDFLKMCYMGEGYGGLVEEECDEEGVDLDSIDSSNSGSASSTTPSNSTDATSSSLSASSSSSQATTAPKATTMSEYTSNSESNALVMTDSIKRSGPPPPITSTPVDSSKTANYTGPIPKATTLTGSHTLFPFGPGRRGPGYQHIPPVRTNVSDVDLTGRPPQEQITAPSWDQTSNLSCGTNSGLSHGSTPAPSCGPTPAPSHGPTPAPSRVPTPERCNTLPSSHGSGDQASPPSLTDPPPDITLTTSSADASQPGVTTLHAGIDSLNTSNEEVGGPEPQGRKQRTAKVDNAGATDDGDHRPMKRPRSQKSVASASVTNVTSSDSPPTSKIMPPPEAPQWFEDALSMFQCLNLGDSWKAIIRSWADFEIHHRFYSLTRLKTLDCPICMMDWIHRSRSMSWRPTIDDFATYELEYKKWWLSLQPGWRLAPDGTVNPSVVHRDWSQLRKPCINGIYSVITCLFFWGHALTVKKEMLQERKKLKKKKVDKRKEQQQQLDEEVHQED